MPANDSGALDSSDWRIRCSDCNDWENYPELPWSHLLGKGMEVVSVFIYNSHYPFMLKTLFRSIQFAVLSNERKRT